MTLPADCTTRLAASTVVEDIASQILPATPLTRVAVMAMTLRICAAKTGLAPSLTKWEKPIEELVVMQNMVAVMAAATSMNCGVIIASRGSHNCGSGRA